MIENHILYGVGKLVRSSYRASKISEAEVMAIYNKNKKEADAYDTFDLSLFDMEQEEKRTHNPLLRDKLKQTILQFKDKGKHSLTQNSLSLAKLEFYRNSALGIGLRPVMNDLRKRAKDGDTKASICLKLMETEFANLSAKRLNHKRKIIYERKNILLGELSDMLYENGWTCGISSNTGKNACYIVYVYLPDGSQLSWHCNDYRMIEYYEYIECVWDGRPCSTFEKILTFIHNEFGIGTELEKYESLVAA